MATRQKQAARGHLVLLGHHTSFPLRKCLGSPILADMAIKHWHGGQVVLVWLVSFILCFVLALIVILNAEPDATSETVWLGFRFFWVLFGATWVIPITVMWISPRTGNVKNWHSGKIVLVWLLGFAATFVLMVVLTDGWSANPPPPLWQLAAVWLLVGASWAVPITWKWLSGKERK